MNICYESNAHKFTEIMFTNISDWKRQQKMIILIYLFRNRRLGIKFSTAQHKLRMLLIIQLGSIAYDQLHP